MKLTGAVYCALCGDDKRERAHHADEAFAGHKRVAGVFSIHSGGEIELRPVIGCLLSVPEVYHHGGGLERIGGVDLEGGGDEGPLAQCEWLGSGVDLGAGNQCC